MGDPITPEQLATWQALADACCPGRWHYDDGITDDLANPPERGKPRVIEVIVTDPAWRALACGQVAPIAHPIPGAFPDHVTDAHGRFIAASREAIPVLIAELQQHRADLRAAAGDLPVPLPAPGTDMARLLTANRLLRHENERLRGWLALLADDARVGSLASRPAAQGGGAHFVAGYVTEAAKWALGGEPVPELPVGEGGDRG